MRNILPEAAHPILAQKFVLIVEDEPLVALDVHAALSAAGASVLSATSAGEAVKLIGHAEIAAAIVDVQLGAEDAAQVCDALARQQILFLFYTGRAERAFLLAQWPDIPILKKPAAADAIVAAMASILRAGVDDGRH